MAKGFVRRGLRAAAIAAVVVLLLLLVLRLALPVVGVRVANSRLSKLLATEVRIGRIELALLRGSLALKDLRVLQPEGFGKGDLLVVPEIRARVKPVSLLHLPVRIEELLLADPGIQIVRNREGNLDLEAILSAVLASSEGIDEEEGDEPEAQGAPPDYPVIVEEAAVRNLWVAYRDDSNEQGPYEAKLENLTFVVTNLSLETSPGAEGTRVGTNRGALTLKNVRIDQPPGFSGEALLTIPEVNLKAHVPSVFKPRLILEEVSVKEVAIRLARNRSGRLNLEALLSEAIPRASGTSEAAQDIPSEKKEDEAPLDWRVLVKRFSLQGFSFLYTDESFQEEPFAARVSNLSLDLNDLLLAPGEGLSDPATEQKPEGEDGKAAGGAKGSLVVRGLHIDQPRGFSGDTLLSWPELEVDFVVDSVFGPSITIESADLVGPRVHLAFDKARRGNVGLLISKAIPQSREPSAQAKPAPPEDRSARGTRVRVNRFSIRDLGLTFTDSSYPEKPMEEVLREADLEVTDLTYDPARAGAATLPTTARMTARRVQQPFADALLGLYARVGTLGNEIPAVNGSLQLGGFELAPMRHTLPPGTAQAIGGDALDLSVDLALAADVLDCNAKVKSIGGSNLSLHIGGTPEQPELDRSNMLFLVFFRSGGALGNVAGKVGGAGVEVADTAVGTVRVVGTGTAKTLGSVGGGIFHTVKGVATADVEGVASGLKKTTIGTIKEGAGTAAGTVGEVRDGAVDVGSAGIGKQQAEAWRKATEERWEKAWKKAQQRVDRKRFPRPK